MSIHRSASGSLHPSRLVLARVSLVSGEVEGEDIESRSASSNAVTRWRGSPCDPVLTAPYGLQGFWHSADAADILRALLHVASEMKTELIVRVHPLEPIFAYERAVREMSSELADVKVTYSQGSSLEPLLARSAVAVTFASTAFLDCLRRHVPIVSFDWHDFSYRRQLEKHGVFHFAGSLAELRQLARRAVLGDLAAFSGDDSALLNRTPADELVHTLSRCVELAATLEPSHALDARSHPRAATC